MMNQYRRGFLKKVLSGVISLPFLSSMPSCHLGDTIDFPGSIIGEDMSLGHRLRDGIFRQRLKNHHFNPIGPSYSCIIVGGGCSGLAAGWRLYQAGLKDFLVIEKNSQLGGTSQSGYGNNTDFSWGAHYIETPPAEANFLYPLYEDLNIITGYDSNQRPIINQDFVVRDPEVQLYMGKQLADAKSWIPHRYPYLLADDHDLASFEKFNRLMYQLNHTLGEDGKKPFTLPIQASSTDSIFRQLDQITMKAYLRDQGFQSELLDWYIDMQCRDNFGTCYHEISAWAALDYFATNFIQFGKKDPNIRPIEVISWPEGNQYLVKGMSRNFIKANIKKNALVVDVRNEKNSVLVTYYNILEEKFYTHRSQSVIFALAKFLLPKIVQENAKKTEKYLKKFEYAPWLVANLHVKQPPAGKPISWDNIYYRELTSKENWSLGYILPNYQNRQLCEQDMSPGVITVYVPLLQDGITKERDELWKYTWKYWAQRIVDDLRFMHPNINDLIERMDINQMGHAMIRPIPNYIWGEARQKLKEPIGRIFMAHCDVSGLPIFEQAAYIGFEAAKSVLKLLNISFAKS